MVNSLDTTIEDDSHQPAPLVGGALQRAAYVPRRRGSGVCSSHSFTSSHSSEGTDYSAENVHIPCQLVYGEDVEYEQQDPAYDGLEPEEVDELDFQVYGEGQNTASYALPLPAHCPSLAPVAAVDVAVEPNPASWNERFQRLLETPPGDAEGMTVLLEEMNCLVSEFVASALDTMTTYVTELELPESYRTLPVAELGGVAGGTKILHDGIFFKFVNASNARIFGDAVYASKAYSAELRANSAILRARCPGVYVPLSAVITFKGLTCYAASEVPLHEGSLIYGSCDTGRRIRTVNRARHWMGELCQKLGLKLHPVRGVHGLSCRMYGPMDIEGHRSGIDGRFYLLDTARLFPSISLARAYRTTLRPECCATNPVALNSDAFSRFSYCAECDEVEIKEACKWVTMTRIPKVVEKLNTLHCGKVSDILHERGICCHWLGRVAAACAADQAVTALRIVQTEIVARTFKILLHRRLTRLYHAGGRGKPGEEGPERDESMVENENVVQTPESIALRYFRNLTNDPKFWRHMLKVMQTEFPDFDEPPNQRALDEARVTKRIEELTGFRMDRRRGGRYTAHCTPVVKVIDFKCRFQGKVPDVAQQESDVLAVLHAREDMLGGMHPGLLSTLQLLVNFYLNLRLFPADAGLPKALAMQKRIHNILESLVIQDEAFDVKLPKHLRQHAGAWASSMRSARHGSDVHVVRSGCPSWASRQNSPQRYEKASSPQPLAAPGGARRPTRPTSPAAWQAAYFDSAERLAHLLTQAHESRACSMTVKNALFIAERLYGKMDERYPAVRDRLCKAGGRSRTCCLS